MKLISLARSKRLIKKWLLQVVRNNKFPFVDNTYLKGNVQIIKSAKINNSKLIGEIIIGNEVHLDNVSIYGHVLVEAYTSIEGGTRIMAQHSKVLIGKFCSIAWNVSIINHSHKVSRPASYYMGSNFFSTDEALDVESKGEIHIENDVWIGAYVTILPGVSIGNGAVIGAGSLVNRDVPDYAIVAGVPAKIIKYRFSEKTIRTLQILEWWNWPIEKIRKNKEFFLNDFNEKFIVK